MAPLVRLLRFFKAVLLDRRVWALGLVAGAVAVYPLAVGALGGHLVTSKAAAKLGVSVEAQRARAGWGMLRLYGVVVGRNQGPLLTVDSLQIPFSALWGRGVVVADGPAANLVRGGSEDNVSAILGRLRGTSPGGAGKASASSLPSLVVRGGSLHLTEARKGLSVTVGVVDATWETGVRFHVDVRQVSGRFGTYGSESNPAFGAESLTLQGSLAGLRPVGWPEASVREGYLRPLATLPLTGISGAVRPAPASSGSSAGAFDLFFSGSYGGAKRALWTATGQLRPSIDSRSLEGTLSLKAERFSLDKIAEILPASVLEPENTEIDAAIEAKLEGRRVLFSGKLDVSGLSLLHEKLASEPVNDLAFGMHVDGAVDLDKRLLVLNEAQGRLGNLAVQLAGSLELAQGTFHFKSGRDLHYLPKLEAHVRVPRIACAKLLASIPAPIVPHLGGFVLQGFFEADLHTKIDLANLDALELGGKVGIDGCQVIRAPAEVTALAGEESLVQTVEVPPEPPGNGASEVMTFIVGPDNPDFVPFSQVSPHLINAIMTTEDSGFFKHRGWVSAVFKTALRRNIENDGFRLGASSITMQMVKNLLLSKEKTLSRKLQELFLVWYLEQILPKERILELYLNAIEFGPRLYGIGPAARHYFGKPASEITPLEAAFFSSILPSPKRRYVHYCHGALSPAWEKYLRRILTRMYERDRLTETEYAIAMASTLTFDRSEMTMTEKQCLEWVRRITAKPEAEVETDTDAQ
ncbi:MAG: biosynthetic peptidoglycan transglycosylase [Polyangia bacterium]